MVYEDTGEVLADGTVEQYGCHGRVYAARQAQNHAVIAQLLFQFGNRCLYKRGCAPFLLATADVDHKVLQQQRALDAVEYLRMELYGPDAFSANRGIAVGCIAHVVGGGDALETIGDGGDGVAVAHPYL